MLAAVRLTVSLLKLRIGIAIAASALAGIAATNGPAPPSWRVAAVALAVLGASGAAGAFNHYYERDLDRLMRRTRGRPFATGAFRPGWWWLAGFIVLLGSLVGARCVSRWGDFGRLRVPRRVHLRHSLYGLA